MKRVAWLVVLTVTLVAIGAANASVGIALPEYGDGCSCHGGTPTPADTTAPTTTSNAAASYVDSASIALSASDAGSGVAATYYTVNGGAQTAGTTVALSGAGTYTVRFWSVDNAGNVETAKTVTVTITASVVTPPVKAARTVVAKVDSSTVRRGEYIKIEGTVSAFSAGEVAELWALAPGTSTWVRLTSVSLKGSYSVSSKPASLDSEEADDDDDDDEERAVPTFVVGKYSVRTLAKVKGTYQFQVRIGASSTHMPSVSKTLTVRVK